MSAATWGRRAVAGLAIAAVVGLVTGAPYELDMRQRAVRDFPPPGKMVEVGGGRRLQLDCRGAGRPTVILESGLDNLGSLSWTAVHDSIAETTRVCAYSRAGIMWSEPSNELFSAGSVARDLHVALINAGEVAPWVMVGHSIGGPYVTTFASLYPNDVRGMVFVDASHPDQFARFREAAGKSMVPQPGIVRLAAALSGTGLLRAVPTAAGPWPKEVGRTGGAFLPTSLRALVSETDEIPATLAAVTAMRSFGDRPFIVLTAGRAQSSATLAAMHVTPAQGARIAAASLALHESQAAWSTCGKHVFVGDASHYIQFDRPDVVIGAVRDVVDVVRRRAGSPTDQGLCFARANASSSIFTSASRS